MRESPPDAGRKHLIGNNLGEYRAVHWDLILSEVGQSPFDFVGLVFEGGNLLIGEAEELSFRKVGIDIPQAGLILFYPILIHRYSMTGFKIKSRIILTLLIESVRVFQPNKLGLHLGKVFAKNLIGNLNGQSRFGRSVIVHTLKSGGECSNLSS